MRRNSLTMNQHILSRPRLRSLIGDGLQRRLLVMLAGPGYGKTQAMADYTARCDARVVWLHLSSLDNLTSHFWAHLSQALERQHPELAQPLRQLEFPDTLPSFDFFARLLEERVGEQERVIWVFDDYGEIHNRQIWDFVRMLTAVARKNFSLALISNTLDSTESLTFLTNKHAVLLADDLRFTRDEIQAFYQLHDVALKPGELDVVERYTEGWPLSLRLLVLQNGQLSDLLRPGEPMTHHVTSRLFEGRFFSNYSQKLQRLLIKLSFLDSFAMTFVTSIYDGDIAELETLENHPFLIDEPETDRFYLHHLYRVYLQAKQYLLTGDEQAQLWRKAAEYYVQSGNYTMAIDCYCRCGDHIGMLGAIRDFVRLQHGVQTHGITPESAAFFLERLDLLTPEEVREHPIADYLRALIYLNTMELEPAETLFADLARRLLADGSAQALELLGDTYAMTGALHMMRCREDFGDYYKKAAAYLPNGTRLQNKRSLQIQNNHNLFIQDNSTGALERMERAMHEGIVWASQVLCGGMSGMEHLYSAEAAYLTNRPHDARQHAYRAIYKAEPHAQHDVVCNAYFLLARVGFLEGNLEEMTCQLQSVGDYAEQHNMGILKEIYDTALGWYYTRLREYRRAPAGIYQPPPASRPALSQGRAVIVYADYLLCIGEYARLVGMLEYPVGLYLSTGIFHDRISRHILLALGHHSLGNRDAALREIWTACDITAGNGLITPFLEWGDPMRALLALARRRPEYPFSSEWLDRVEGETGAFSERADSLRAEYRRKNPLKITQNNPLTKREQDVLQAVARGLTREEIAVEKYISVNTVKSTISHIYNKLGSSNKADAVSIAIKNGFIEGYSPE